MLYEWEGSIAQWRLMLQVQGELVRSKLDTVAILLPDCCGTKINTQCKSFMVSKSYLLIVNILCMEKGLHELCWDVSDARLNRASP